MGHKKVEISRAQTVYGAVVCGVVLSAWLICVAGPVITMAFPDRNMLNPFLVFEGIWEGGSIEDVWLHAGDGFPGGHFYLQNFFSGDGFTQFGIVLGSSAALFGLLAASVEFLREKSYGYAAASVFVATAIILAMAGVVSI